jgi:predicted O-methyltransferase YrrM
MPSTGGIAAIKSLVPGPVKSSLRGAHRALRDRVRAVSRRITRPNLYRLSSPERVGAVYGAPTDMSVDEKLFLYSFVRGFRPQRSLEIGVAMGGSALITANAMEENGVGMHVGVDPTPNLKVAWRDLHARFKLIAGRSPEAIPEARAAAGGPFEFVLIDGLHRYDQVRTDITAILPHLADGAYLLFHDAFHYGVAAAIREAIEASLSLVDCGYPCRTANVYADPVTPYNGFRLLRWTAAAVAPRSVDVEQVLEPIYVEHRRPRPPCRADLLNHDIWYCKAVSPCEYCRSKQAASAGGNGA